VGRLTRFSANLGFLWADLPLPKAIAAAKAAGFDAVECHWPYDTPAADTARALHKTGLQMLGLNTQRGKPGENGLSALPGREAEARTAIDQALTYALAIRAGMVHVMAGFASGPEAEAVFVANLTYAVQRAGSLGITILIEPLNRHDAPGYFLQTTDQALTLINAVGAPNLKLMFDCYHVGRTEGDITTRFQALLPHIGHVQFASVPDRGAPDEGELNYSAIFGAVASLGWTRPLGAEYKPKGPTGETLGWMTTLRAAPR
jgi:2-dehydrotetronate isomerase